MSGIIGRSGRKGRFWERSLEELLDMSHSTIRAALMSDELPLTFRADLAMKFSAKHLPDTNLFLAKIASEPINDFARLDLVTRISQLIAMKGVKCIEVQAETSDNPGEAGEK